MSSTEDNYRLKSFFKRSILNRLEKIDANSDVAREAIYKAANSALHRVHNSNKFLQNKAKVIQINLISDVIKEIEIDILHSKTSMNDQFISKSNISIFIIPIISIFLFLSAYFYKKDETQKYNQVDIIKYEIPVDDILFKRIKKRGKERNSLLTKVDNGIEYKLLNKGDNSRSAIDIIVNAVDAKQLKLSKNLILLKLQIQNNTNLKTNIGLVVRGLGKNARKNIRVMDKKVNEYFLVLNDGQSKKSINRIVITIQISTDVLEDTNPSIILQKISFEELLS